MEGSSDDMLLASAISYLIDGQELYEAGLLLLCDLSQEVGSTFYSGDYGITNMGIELTGNRTVFEIIQNRENPATIAIKRAFEAVLPSGFSLDYLTCRVAFTNFNSDWRSQLLEVVQGKEPLNQCLPIGDKPRFPWEHLLFRSPHEISIAKALDEHDVLFLPNCMARLSSPTLQKRGNKEADFLICYESKWGILEVDGETYHPSAAQDHERDRLFASYGIKVIQRFTAKQCLDNPKGVVQQFLSILQKNG